MTRPISEDLRIRVVQEREDAKKSYEELAAQFRLGRATVSRILRLHRETGTVVPKPHGGGMPLRIADSELSTVKTVVDVHRDATLEELAVLCGEALGRTVSRATVGRAMVRLRLLAQEEGAHSIRAKSPKRRGKASGVSRRDGRR